MSKSTIYQLIFMLVVFCSLAIFTLYGYVDYVFFLSAFIVFACLSVCIIIFSAYKDLK